MKNKRVRWSTVKVRVETVEVWPRRDPRRIGPTIEALKRAWKRAPDLRLGQLLCAVLGDQTGFKHVEDAYVLKAFRKDFPR